MSIRYKGDVPFEDSEGRPFVLRLSTFNMIEHEKELDAIGDSRKRQFVLFHYALQNGSEEQKEFTLEDASEIADDIGYDRVNDLLNATKWGTNIVKSLDLVKRNQERSTAVAAAVLASKVEGLRDKFNGDGGTAALDAVLAALKPVQDKGDSANP